MLIRYKGPADGVTLAPNTGGIHFPNGQPVDVPDELAARLLEQDTFEKVVPAKPQGRGSAASSRRNVESR